MQANRKKPGMKMLEKSSETLNCSRPRSANLGEGLGKAHIYKETLARETKGGARDLQKGGNTNINNAGAHFPYKKNVQSCWIFFIGEKRD